MRDSKYLNLPASGRSRGIYRIIPKKRLYELFENRQNVLVSPRKWKDPFEDAALNGVFPRVGTFGQCWTLHTASDAMWRIYSPKSGGIRIRTTIQRLLDSLAGTLKDNDGSAFIGRVEYKKDSELIQLIRWAFSKRSLNDPSERANTLLAKRRAFSHEKEVRLILVKRHSSPQENYYTYSVNPHELFNQIMIDPYLTVDNANRLRDEICHRTQFPKEKIKRSLLYTLPEEISSLIQRSSAKV